MTKPNQSPALETLRIGRPTLWLNENRRQVSEFSRNLPVTRAMMNEAADRMRRARGLLATVFRELRATDGLIESPLIDISAFRYRTTGERSSGRWFLKADHGLPVAGSIKARGGFHEVLAVAERLAIAQGLSAPNRSLDVLASPEARALFERYEIAVGSTGNLGLSIGMIARGLGFRATVHMSHQAKAWKKARLRANGVEVVEHEGDYEAAVAAGRAEAARRETSYFVDDENSILLFLGYTLAAFEIEHQLAALNVAVDGDHPLFVHVPCGVGGAPGGVSFGLRQLLGDDVHCFLAEPTASPCMLLRLANPDRPTISVRDIGLSNQTEADGLAVPRASALAAAIAAEAVDGVFTARDEDLFSDLQALAASESIEIEPSAAAALRGPRWIETLSVFTSTQKAHATHILWATGGALAPKEERESWLQGIKQSDEGNRSGIY